MGQVLAFPSRGKSYAALWANLWQAKRRYEAAHRAWQENQTRENDLRRLEALRVLSDAQAKVGANDCA